jgi:DNA invertase Pin-like site-specific DNA recombinase
LIGNARCSTDRQDLAAQRHTLRALGVSDDRVYLDHRMTGTNRARPGLEQALAAVRQGDTLELVVPKLDRLARSVPDARAIGDSLAARGIKLSLGATVYDPTDPMGKCFFNILATFAEFEVDLLRMRTREGMWIAKANGKLKGKAPKLIVRQQAQLVKLYRAGEQSVTELAELFSVVARRSIARSTETTTAPDRAPTNADARPGRQAQGPAGCGNRTRDLGDQSVVESPRATDRACNGEMPLHGGRRWISQRRARSPVAAPS